MQTRNSLTTGLAARAAGLAMSVTAAIAILALALFSVDCSGGERASAPPPPAGAAATDAAHHPETFEAAKALAVERKVPLFVDFYSPT